MRLGLLAIPLCVAVSILVGAREGIAQPADSSAIPPAPPPARKIPGITAEDAFPKACVSCHVNMPEQNMDVRLSTLMKAWTGKVEPALLSKAQAAAPAGVTLKGKHPAVTAALRDIPAGCVKCHGPASKKAPPFARMMHLIHLGGGDESRFLSLFQGECTHCHKLDLKTGAWAIPSAPEP